MTNTENKLPGLRGWLSKDPGGEVFFHYQQPRWEVQSEDSAWWGSDDREFEIFDCPIDIEVEKPIEVELLFKTV